MDDQTWHVYREITKGKTPGEYRLESQGVYVCESSQEAATQAATKGKRGGTYFVIAAEDMKVHVLKSKRTIAFEVEEGEEES